jgi:hypothetical protein
MASRQMTFAAAGTSAVPSPATAPDATAHNGGLCTVGHHKEADPCDPQTKRRTRRTASSTERHAAAAACQCSVPATVSCSRQNTPDTTNSSRSTIAGSAGTPRTEATPCTLCNVAPSADTASPTGTTPPARWTTLRNYPRPVGRVSHRVLRSRLGPTPRLGGEGKRRITSTPFPRSLVCARWAERPIATRALRMKVCVSAQPWRLAAPGFCPGKCVGLV